MRAPVSGSANVGYFFTSAREEERKKNRGRDTAREEIVSGVARILHNIKVYRRQAPPFQQKSSSGTLVILSTRQLPSPRQAEYNIKQRVEQRASSPPRSGKLRIKLYFEFYNYIS